MVYTVPGIASSRSAVFAALPVAFAMSPAPTRTGSSDGPGGGGGGGAGVVVNTSCGANEPDSRVSKAAPSELVVVTPMDQVPLPVIVPVTSSSTQVLRATAPSEPSATPSIAGCELQVGPVSVQEVLLIRR